ncbi:hypothetical protein ACQP2T_48330 [Nonomuraea sp. CA-143628]|uniref:hypothetical protein n=1 Tax=Nonomuraea sp. CA-143628 TaxID=3239997 RepID=UPI003D8E3B58
MTEQQPHPHSHHHHHHEEATCASDHPIDTASDTAAAAGNGQECDSCHCHDDAQQ